MDGSGEVVMDGAFAVPAPPPPIRPRPEPETVRLFARAARSAPPRRAARLLLAGLGASAAVHAVLIAALVQVRMEEAKPAPPPPIFVELPPPFPLPEASAEPAPAEAPVADATEAPPAPTASQPSTAPEPRTRAAPQPSPAPARLTEPAPAQVAEPVTRPVTTLPTPAPAPRLEPSIAPKAPEPLPAPSSPATAASTSGYEGRVMARLASAKRYPTSARARREEGTARVRFSVSRQGRVTGAALAASSGSAALDREALETVRRAQPLPAVPPELSAPLQLTLAIEFRLR